MTSLRMRTGDDNLVQNVFCVLLGAGFTVCLFLGIAHFGNLAPHAPPAEIEDVRAIAMAPEPPPPRTSPAEAEPSQAVATDTGFEFAPSDSPVKIAVSPPTFDQLAPAAQLAPPAVIYIGGLEGDFKPRLGPSIDPQHVFMRTEVDVPPKVLYRPMPAVPPDSFKKANSLRATLVVLVSADGVATSVRVAGTCGNPEVDAVLVENIREWRFSPAIRRGIKVRCLIEQPYRIELRAASPFETKMR